eukprot:jgi/Antlo1/1799/1884
MHCFCTMRIHKIRCSNHETAKCLERDARIVAKALKRNIR